MRSDLLCWFPVLPMQNQRMWEQAKVPALVLLQQAHIWAWWERVAQTNQRSQSAEKVHPVHKSKWCFYSAWALNMWWREVLPHVVGCVVCLLCVVDIRTVALFRWQLLALKICFIFCLHQQTWMVLLLCLACSSRHFGQSGHQHAISVAATLPVLWW